MKIILIVAITCYIAFVDACDFEKIDKDDDGFISKSEFRKEIKFLMKKEGKKYTNKEISEFFDRLDSDGDGKINFEEFNAPIEGRGGCIGVYFGKRGGSDDDDIELVDPSDMKYFRKFDK